MHIIQSPLFDFEAFITDQSNNRLVGILEALPAEKLLIALELEHWTGRKGYSVRGMWSAMISGLLNNCHSLAGVASLLKRDKETRLVCGFSTVRGILKVTVRSALSLLVMLAVAVSMAKEHKYEEIRSLVA